MPGVATGTGLNPKSGKINILPDKYNNTLENKINTIYKIYIVFILYKSFCTAGTGVQGQGTGGFIFIF